MTDVEYEQWLEREFASLEKSDLLRLASLGKYTQDPAFTERFIDAAASAAETIPRAPRGLGPKKVSEQEFRAGSYEFFHERQSELSAEFRERLCTEIDEEKVEIFLSCMAMVWTDGKVRQSDPTILRIKASIRQHDALFGKRNVFVRDRVAADIDALFSPQETAKLFELNALMAATCMDDYLENRPDWLQSSINHVHLHRGIYPRKPIRDQLMVEQNYLTSYSLAATVAEAFSQVLSSIAEGTVYPTILSAPFPLFERRIVAFSPLIVGMTVEQLEVVTAPPVEPLPLKQLGVFEFEGTKFLECSFDEVPPGSRWTGPLPDGILIDDTGL
jgi:hypothetical protein